MKTLSHGRKMSSSSNSVCKAFTLVTSSCFVPNRCELCELINISFLFQKLCSPLITFCLLVPIDIDRTLLFIASHPKFPLFNTWCDSLYILFTFFFIKFSFPLLILPVSLPGFVIPVLMYPQLCIPMESQGTVFLISMEAAIFNSAWKLPSPLWLFHLLVPLFFSFKTYFCLWEMHPLEH